MTEPRPNRESRLLPLGIAGVVALYAVLYRFVPYDIQAFLLWPFGALAIYSGARLRWWQAAGLVFAVQFGTDLAFYLINHWGIPRTTYLTWGLFLVLGLAVRPLVRRNTVVAIAGAAAASIVGYAMFFLVTNTAAWLGNAEPYYQPHNFETLMRAYAEGLEFLRGRPGEVFGNPVCVILAFGAHALLARASSPAGTYSAEEMR
jgi:hypothetical protein